MPLTRLADAIAVEPAVKPKTLPAKGSNEALLHWQVTVGGYRLVWPGGRFDLRIGDQEWIIKGNIGKTTYHGVRNTLEAAYKAVDNMIHDQEIEVWLKVSSSVILQTFQGDLTHL